LPWLWPDGKPADSSAAGQAPPKSIPRTQDLYENHFDDSPVWQQAPTARL